MCEHYGATTQTTTGFSPAQRVQQQQPVCLICCSTSLTLPPSQQESTTLPPNSFFQNLKAGTNSNCIQHQLIQFFKKSRRIQNPCRQIDWVTRLLCLVSLLLIFLLLLPFPLHCGVYLLFSDRVAGADCSQNWSSGWKQLHVFSTCGLI